MKLLKILLAHMILLSLGFATNGIDVNFNAKDLELRGIYSIKLSKTTETFFSAGFLNAAVADEGNVSKDATTMYDLQATHFGFTELEGISFGVGAKFFRINQLNVDANTTSNKQHSGIISENATDIKRIDNVTGLAITGKLAYTLPLIIRTVSSFSLAYTPSPFALSKHLENSLEMRLDIASEPINNAWVYVGYRYINVKLKDLKSKYDVNNKAYIGLKVMF